MASGLSHIVFNDEFTIDDIDKEGRKFDRGEIASPNASRDQQHRLTNSRIFPLPDVFLALVTRKFHPS